MYPTEEQAQAALLEVVHRPPLAFGHEQSRWTLDHLLRTCDWLNLTSQAGLWRLLRRLGIAYKRGRTYLHSPDPDYDAKLAYRDACFALVMANPERFVWLYLDELTYYRQPSLALAYEQQGAHCPLARLSHQANARYRGLGALNALTGQVTYHQAYKITPDVQVAFYAQLCQTYPWAETIFVAQDNWPNHAHPRILAPLEAQRSPFWPNTFPNWSTVERYISPPDAWPIQLVFLPTYAPWTNPIEKLWHWLKRQVLHLHRVADDWPALKQQVLDFMDQFATGSDTLLRYVGLLPD